MPRGLYTDPFCLEAPRPVATQPAPSLAVLETRGGVPWPVFPRVLTPLPACPSQHLSGFLKCELPEEGTCPVCCGAADSEDVLGKCWRVGAQTAGYGAERGRRGGCERCLPVWGCRCIGNMMRAWGQGHICLSSFFVVGASMSPV